MNPRQSERNADRLAQVAMGCLVIGFIAVVVVVALVIASL